MARDRKKQVAQDQLEYLSSRLTEDVPPGARLGLCLDPEEVLADRSTVADQTGRLFRLLSYRGDDLALRRTLRQLETAGTWSGREPVLLVAAWPELMDPGTPLELSSLADLLARVEGRPIDLRTDAVVTHYTEPVVWPANLQQHASRIGRDLPAFVAGYWRMRSSLGPGRPLAEHHIAAILLLAGHPMLRLEELDGSTAYLPELVARTLSLAARHGIRGEEEPLLWQVVGELSRQGRAPEWQTWVTLGLESATRLVVLGEILQRHGVPHPAASLAGRGLLPLSAGTLDPVLPTVIRAAQEDAADWLALGTVLDAALPLADGEQAMALLACAVPPARWLELVSEEQPGILALALIQGALEDALEHTALPRLRVPAGLPRWVEARLADWEVPHADAPPRERAAALLRMLHRLSRVQDRLQAPLPAVVNSPAELLQLVEAYVESDDHRLELLLALARKDADALGHESRLRRLDRVCVELTDAVAARLDRLDRLVGDWIAADPRAYFDHPRSTARWLRPQAGRAARTSARLFVWLFDGMRWDSWIDVVRPLLEEGFRVEEQRPLLAVLPTHTRMARPSIFAGAHPLQGWKGLRGGFTRDEGELAARTCGLGTKEELVFLTHTDEAEGKARLRELQPRRYNCLVFNISDDNIHHSQGDLREVNDAIRMKIKRDVLPEMKRLVQPGDLVLVTSDHGFVQLRREQALPVTVQHEEEPEVKRRYASGREDLEGVLLPYGEKPGRGTTTCAVGRTWYARDGRSGPFVRYDHGGISLGELVVPGVVLHRALEPEAVRLEVIAPERLIGREDEPLLLQVRIANQGTALETVRLQAADRPARTIELARRDEFLWEVELTGSLGLKQVLLTVEVRTPAGFVPVQHCTRLIPVVVERRKDKVVFSDGLAAFDDLGEES